jgi:hypothetical protein
VPKGNIIIARKVLKDAPDWSKSEKKLRKLTVAAEGTIEDSSAEMHADFANMYIGGGALEGVKILFFQLAYIQLEGKSSRRNFICY